VSVLMTLRVKGDGSKLEEMAAGDPDLFRAVAERGAAQGATFHRFYASDDEVLVVDEWTDAESFHAFFESETDIPEMMARAGATGEPEVKFWRKLDTKDDIG
jgi:heme-degrading monooxygenase HmoA